MPHSYKFFKEDIKKYLSDKYHKESTILDVGPGVGTYSDLLKLYFPNIDCCEIFEPYVKKYKLQNKYKNVYVCNICDFEFDRYDVIILGDVLEHLSIEDGQKLLEKFKNKCNECIICVPYKTKQRASNNNIYEIHLQNDLTVENMKTRYPYLKLINNNEKYGWYILDNSCNSYNTNIIAAKKFVDVGLINKKNKNLETSSGYGSTLNLTKTVRSFLTNTILKYNIKSILDLGCGDFNWMSKIDLSNINYTGYDCHEQLIKENTIKYGKDNIKFECKDILNCNYPEVDLILCRDVMFHLNQSLAEKLLSKIKQSNSIFLLATTFPNNIKNFSQIKISSGIKEWYFHMINLDIEPFNMIDYKLSSMNENIPGYNRHVVLYKLN